MSNTALWDAVYKTDPAQVKAITGKPYSGNSPKPYYIVRRLTEQFGPCGHGWGFTIFNERMERLTPDDVLHVACVRLWYMLELPGPGQKCEVEQIGQTRAMYKTAAGKLLVDEDAPKKSVTDALIKCASYLGFAGDIFSGMWDDSGYVAELRKEFAEDPKMDPKILGDWLAFLADAASTRDLTVRLDDAVKAAKEVGDAAAEAKFVEFAMSKRATAKKTAA